MPQHHYFVSHGLGWATAATLEEAVEKAFCTNYYTDMGKWCRNTQKKGNPGIAAYACRVPLPEDAQYEINSFQPQVAGISECQNIIVTYVTTKKVAWMRDPQDEVRLLKDRIAELEQPDLFS